MKTYQESLAQTYSYLSLRKAVGWIGILLPFVLITGIYLLFDGDPVLKTISLYYHSGMRDVFVGSICAIALFLFYYRGYSKWDNRAGNLAGFFAIGIALFPTTKSGGQEWSGIVHFICAVMFFLILSAFSLFLFTRKSINPSKEKLQRNKIYTICGIAMLLSLTSIMICFCFFDFENSQSCFVFWAETVALMAFGISWLTKGGTLYPDVQSDNLE